MLDRYSSDGSTVSTGNAMTKHYKEVTLKSGRTVYGFNPSPTLRSKLGYKWEAYSTPDEAKARAEDAAASFVRFQRTGSLPQNADRLTVCGLVDAYQRTTRWRKIADKPNSRRAYESALRSALTSCAVGSKPLCDLFVADITPMAAEDLYSAMCATGSISSANAVIKVLGVVWSNGERLNLVTRNPFSKLGLFATPDRDVTWTDDQINLFIATADQNQLSSIGTIALMAFDLCQRPIDCRQMLWSNYSDGIFTFKQQKTGVGIDVPASGALIRRIEAITSNRNPLDAISIYEATGEPFSERLYRKKAQLIREMAGLPAELKVSDLRRTGATLLGSSSCTEDEIRSITGHKSRQVVSVYVKTNRIMATTAQNKRHANSATSQ